MDFGRGARLFFRCSAAAAPEAGDSCLLGDLGVTQAERPDDPVETLSVAAQQIVEIAKGVSRNASLLIMDEPTASLGGAEVRALFELIRRLRDRGTPGRRGSSA